MFDVVVYIYPMGCEEFNTLHMTLKGIKEKSNSLLQWCNLAMIQCFVLSRDGSLILSSTPVFPTWKTGAVKPLLAKTG